MKKARIITLIIAGVLLITGIALVLSAWAMNGFDFSKLESTNWTQKNYDTTAEGITALSLDDLNNSIELLPSSDNSIHITYYESDKDIYTITNQNGKIDMQYDDLRKWYEYFFNFNINFKKVTIELPADYNGTLDLHTTNGSITANDMTNLLETRLSTTNGSIEVSGLTVNDNLVLKTNNGNVSIKDAFVSDDLELGTVNGRVTAENTSAGSADLHSVNGRVSAEKLVGKEFITMDSTNADILLDMVDAQESIQCSTTNGKVSGTVVGSMNDYSILSHTTNGSNNLPNEKEGGSKELEVSTVNGSIKIEFSLD